MDEVIENVKALQRKIDALYEEQDKLLEPLFKQAIAEDDPTKTMALIAKLPSGFYKSELRTHHITRMQDLEYKNRYKTGAVEQ
jgi:hypothetical protein